MSYPTSLLFGAAEGLGTGAFSTSRYAAQHKQIRAQEQIFGEQVQNTAIGNALVSELQDAVQNSKLKDTAPDVQQQIIKEKAAGTGYEIVYIDTEMAMEKESGRKDLEAVARAANISSEELETAIEEKGTLAVPLECFAQAESSPELLESASYKTEAQSIARMKKEATETIQRLKEADQKHLGQLKNMVDVVAEEYFPADENDKQGKARQDMCKAIIMTFAENPAMGWNEMMKMVQSERMELLQPALDFINETSGKGTVVIPTEDGKGFRATNNFQWYSEWSKNHNYRAMTKADKEEMAEEMIRGNVNVGIYRNIPPEALAADIERLDEINGKIKALDEIKDKMKELNGVEMRLTEGLTKEGFSVYRAVYDQLKEAKGYAPRSARTGAIIYARHADLYAKIMQEKGNSKYTAKDFLARNGIRFGGQQQGEFNQIHDINPVIRAQMEAIKKMYTNDDGSMKEGYLKAPNGQPSNLNEEQWLLVRTNGFKRWFGNWLYDPNTKIEGTELDNLAGFFPEKGKKDAIRNWLKDLIQGSEVSIDYDGAVVGLQKKRIRASASKSIKDAKVSAYPKLNELIRKSVYLGFEEKDARHENKGVDGQEVYISLAKIDDNYFAVRLKMDVDETKKYLAYKAHQVFTISDVDIIAIGKEDKVFHGLPDENQDVHRPLPPSFNASISDLVNEINQQITDDEMAKLKVPVDENGKPLTSKIVDENGEPLVVYHGSDNNFDVFDASKTRSSMDIQGSFFSPWIEDAMGYGNNVRAFFLNIKNPANSAKGYKALNTYKGQKEAGIKARDLLAKQGFDGVNNDNEEYIVFESNQIKSATDNNGNYDANNPNVYYQVDGGENVEKQMYGYPQNSDSNTQPVEKFYQSAWHGSPYDFDEFDLGAIGSGEGAQAHGWGLYFAADRKISEGYKKQLSGQITIDGDIYRAIEYSQAKGVMKNERYVEDEILFRVVRAIEKEGTYEKAVEKLKKDSTSGLKGLAAKSQKALEILQKYSPESVYINNGKLFEVDIPDSDVMLDEQKTLAEQPEKVRKAVTELLHSFVEQYSYKKKGDKYVVYKNNKAFDKYEDEEQAIQAVEENNEASHYYFRRTFGDLENIDKLTGRNIYQGIRQMSGYQDKNASLKLLKYGVKGITYAGAADGRCYVVFDDKAISIIEKFNQGIKGSITPMSNGKRIINIFEAADESTFLHEMGHLFLLDLEELAQIDEKSAQELATVTEWATYKKEDVKGYKGTPFESEFLKLAANIEAAEKNGDIATAEQLKRKWMHERFARGFEMYLEFGQAPSTGLKSVFRKFKQFLIHIYIGFTGEGVRATPEVERIMARMIASDSEIEAAALSDRYKDITKAGGEKLLTETESETMARWHEEAKAEAKEKLLAIIMKDLKEENVREYQAKLDKEREDVTRFIESQPVYIAQKVLSENGGSKEDVVAMGIYGSIEQLEADLDAVKDIMPDRAIEDRMADYAKELDQQMIDEQITEEKISEIMNRTYYHNKLLALETAALEDRTRSLQRISSKTKNAIDEANIALDGIEYNFTVQKKVTKDGQYLGIGVGYDLKDNRALINLSYSW